MYMASFPLNWEGNSKAPESSGVGNASWRGNGGGLEESQIYYGKEERKRNLDFSHICLSALIVTRDPGAKGIFWAG